MNEENDADDFFREMTNLAMPCKVDANSKLIHITFYPTSSLISLSTRPPV